MFKIFHKNLRLIFCIIAVTTLFSGCGKSRSLPTQTLLNKALKKATEGNWKQALEYLEIVTEREPNNVSALVFTALAYEGCGKNTLALNTARLAVKTDPENIQAQYTLGRLYAKDPGKIQDAVAPLLRVLEAKPDDINTLLLLARCSQALKLGTGIKYYKQLSKTREFRNNALLWNEMGIYYAEHNKVRDAASCFVKAYKLAPSKPLVVLNFATFVDQYFGDSKRALAYYRKYLKISVESPGSEARRERVKARIEKITRH